jgi:microcystin-dependent protein
MEPFIGMIVQFGGNFAPRGWAFCDGQLLPISQNQALFSILGTTYGGDGKTTFALPDLRGRVAIHPGHGPGLSAYRLGETGGHESVTLTINNMPSHNHSFSGIEGDAKADSPTGNILGKSTIYSGGTPNAALASGVIGNAGGSQPFDVRQPYGCVNFLIALVGIFPSRG